MKPLQPYLYFNGKCGEAMNFYASVFGGKLNLRTYAEAPNDPHNGGDRIMHAHLNEGELDLMASDAPIGQPVGVGGNFALSVQCESAEIQDGFFAALAEGGRIAMPLQDTFWGARFGMLFDRFGTQWMLNYPLEMPK